MNARPRVLVLVREFPQISQTYIKNELETLARDYELRIIALGPANVAEPEHLPFRVTRHMAGGHRKPSHQLRRLVRGGGAGRWGRHVPGRRPTRHAGIYRRGGPSL